MTHSAAILGDQLHASNGDTSEEPADILTVEEAENIRRATLNRQQIHSQMRQILDSVRRGEALRQPDILVRNAPAHTPWRQYLATHKEWRNIIGSGINHFSLQFFQDQPDPNAFGQLRLDFVAQQISGIVCRLHPGATE